MVQIRPARIEDAEAVCRFLAANMGRGLSEERYRALFHYPWLRDKPNSGYLLTDEGRVVGFLGAVYADRDIDGVRTRFCNMSSWCVLPGYRNHSIQLLAALLKEKGQTFTNLSPTEAVEKILKGLRFQVLDTGKLFSFPLAHVSTVFHRPRPNIILDPAEIAGGLSPEELVLLKDHSGIGCGHLLLRLEDRSCYLIWKRRVKRSVPFSELLYVSDPALALRYFEAVKLRICRQDGTFLLAADERILGDRPPYVIAYKRVALFKSPHLRSGQIDNLYSELALL